MERQETRIQSLLADPAFSPIVDRLAKVVERAWSEDPSIARERVIDVLRDARMLRGIVPAFEAARATGGSLAPVKAAMRRGLIQKFAERLHEALKGDAEFDRLIRLVIAEVRYRDDGAGDDAERRVWSAIGEPRVLFDVHQKWLLARAPGHSAGYAKVTVRARLLDLVRQEQRGDGRPPRASAGRGRAGARDRARQSELAPAEQGPELPAAGREPTIVLRAAPLAEANTWEQRQRDEQRDIAKLLQEALECLASVSDVTRRQAELLELVHLDEVPYKELSKQLAVSQGALRVRVHKAMEALRRHVQRGCHHGLEDWHADHRGLGLRSASRRTP